MIVITLSALSFGCAGIEARHRTDSELKGRLSEVERELATYHPGEEEQALLRRFEKLCEEEHTIGRELYRRCRAGDQDACRLRPRS